LDRRLAYPVWMKSCLCRPSLDQDRRAACPTSDSPELKPTDFCDDALYRGGRPPLGDGAGRELDAGDGLLDLGIGCEALDDWPILAGLRPDDVIPGAGDDTGAV